jgi:hypothetical protein
MTRVGGWKRESERLFPPPFSGNKPSTICALERNFDDSLSDDDAANE